MEQYHEKMGYMGIDKTCDILRRSYYWPGLYKEVINYIQSFIVCHGQSRRQEKAPLERTDVPNFPFEKISMDVSGPYREISRGNIYIMNFVDWWTNCSEAYAVPDKRAQMVADLVMNEYSLHMVPQLVTDNGLENMNKIMTEVLLSLNVVHVTTSPYHPQCNTKVERFHRTLGDELATLARDTTENWDL